jgi:hypothetical protein
MLPKLLSILPLTHYFPLQDQPVDSQPEALQKLTPSPFLFSIFSPTCLLFQSLLASSWSFLRPRNPRSNCFPPSFINEVPHAFINLVAKRPCIPCKSNHPSHQRDWDLPLLIIRGGQTILTFTQVAQSRSFLCTVTHCPATYVLSHAIKMQLFWSQLRANDVLPCVLIFDYLKYNQYYYFEVI